MLIIGHRGAKGLASENTMASLKAAVEHKVDGVEFDVRTTADGLPILTHDATMCGLRVAQADYRQLKELEPSLITLDEAMRFLHKRSTVVIEVKPGTDIVPIIETIEDRLKNGWELHEISLSSFDFKLLKRAKQLLPGVRVIVNEAWSGVRATRRARKLGTKFITMNQKWLYKGFIEVMVRRGFKLSTYTINDPAKATRLQTLGVHAVITDFPDRVRKPEQ